MNNKNHEVICCDLDGEYTLYCDICDKTIKLKSEKKQFKSLYHTGIEHFVHTNHTIQNPNFSDIDKIYDDYITNHNKKIELYFVKIDFKLDFGPTLQTLITSEIYLNIEHFHLTEFLKRGIECIILTGYKFSHIPELNNKTFSSKRNMTYEYYIKKPMPLVERRIKMINSRKPHLSNTLVRGVKHPLSRKYSHIPFSN